MLRARFDQFFAKRFHPSPQFERFLTTGTAAVLGALIALAAAVGGIVALWHGEWADGVVRFMLAAAFGMWSMMRPRGSASPQPPR